MNKCNRCETSNSDKAKYCSGCGYELPKIMAAEQKPEVKPAKESKRYQILGIIVGTVFFALSYALVQYLFFGTPSLEKMMTKVANEMNKDCPQMVDSETRLDNATVIPPDIFQYNYTLINIEKGDLDTSIVKENLSPNIINFVRTSSEMKAVREKKVTVNYNYRDKNGAYVFRISVSPEQYK